MLIVQFRKITGSVRRWYLSPEQRIGSRVYEMILGRLVNMGRSKDVYENVTLVLIFTSVKAPFPDADRTRGRSTVPITTFGNLRGWADAYVG